MSSPSIFFLGATGYLGSEVLMLLAKEYPNYPVTALVRNATDARRAALHKIHSNLTVIDGTLNDASIIDEAVQMADIVFNIASSDHWHSVKGELKSILNLLEFTPIVHSNSRWSAEEVSCKAWKPTPIYTCFRLRYHQRQRSGPGPC